jgi:outer membrane immunogenic protein
LAKEVPISKTGMPSKNISEVIKRSNTMFAKKLVLSLVAGAITMSIPAFSQEEAPASKNEASVQAFGSFVKSTTSDGVDQSATNSGGVLASYRFFFTQPQGVEANYGYALNTQNYGLSTGPIGVKTNSHEISGDYVLRFPQKHWSPFVLAGVGALVFDPRDFAGASSQGRVAFVYGAGADFNLSRHAFVRAEYRGFVYNSPTYDVPGLNGLDRLSHRAEPSVGFGYRF